MGFVDVGGRRSPGHSSGPRPTSRGFAALALGLAGIAVLLGADGPTFGEGKLLGIAFALGAAVLFALGAVLNRKALPVPPSRSRRGRSD